MIRQQTFIRLFLFACALVLSTNVSFAQNKRTAREKALEFLQQHFTNFGLTQQDVSDTRVTNEYVTKHNGVTHVWVLQQYRGIPVFNGLIGLHVAADGTVYHVGHRFVQDLQRHINTALPAISASKALEMAMANIGFNGFPVPSLRTKTNDQNFIFQGGVIAKQDIPVSACYAKLPDGSVRLAWTMIIDQANTSDVWNMRVDALTGLVLDKINQTVYCNGGDLQHEATACDDAARDDVSLPEIQAAAPAELLLDESYNVFPLPAESPLYGARSVVVNPNDLLASPYGWLDTNGVTGAEFTYTRGNNAWAFNDSANDNTPSEAESADAGASLNFDFPYDPNAEPPANALAAITNLFYVNNKMHDFTYRYGFDEAAGNFQEKNYGPDGVGGDGVLAQALDGSGINNADFATFPDGYPGRMQMFLWNQQSTDIVKVNAPGVVTGIYFGGLAATWGGPVTSTPLTADVVVVNDDIEPTLGCEPPTNNVTGKIVMIDRGDCEFGFKALTVQQAGAVACIICDHEAPPLGGGGMGPGVVGAQVTIPTLYMKKADWTVLRQYAGAGLNISLVLPPANPGPAQLDGDFDNGVIAHEYGHGVSGRLVGGANNTGCLGNDEQMGEGWSDFFALANTVRPGDSGTTKRGLGKYILRQPPNGNGIRRYPYSTDLSVDPLTYSAVAENPEVHSLGEVWAAMTWDLYWAMVEKYGYDADINNTGSGNFRAVQLVMDGLKIQPCEPGFQDGRDAILMADKMNYNGADTCLISTVFARRGLGYLASQGSRYVATDGVENFDPIPPCVKELKIKKVTTTPLINPGDNAEFVITVTNHKDVAAPNVVVNDEIPVGLTVTSASNGGIVSGNMVVWNLGTVQSGQVIPLTYTAKSAPNVGSQSYFHDLMETEDDWSSVTINTNNIQQFELETDDVHTGSAAWRAPEDGVKKTDFVLAPLEINTLTITGSNPILRFWHKFNTQQGIDPGFIEFIDNDLPNPVWRRVTNAVTFRNGYNGKVSYGTSYAFPNHFAFSGNSDGWIQSYFDMSAYSGKNISFRFRFGTDNDVNTPGGGYWIVDDVEAMDMLNFDTEACVSSGSDHACDRADARGVIVEPATVGTKEPTALQLPMTVQPNPANDFVYVTIAQAVAGPVQFSVISADGRVVMTKNMAGLAAGQVTAFDVQNLPAGVYIVQLESAAYRSNAKVVKR